MKKPPKISGGLLTHLHLTAYAVSTSWLSFGTARRRDLAPSHFERGLKPARPGLSLGVFGRFGTMACFHADASPNEGIQFRRQYTPLYILRQGSCDQ